MLARNASQCTGTSALKCTFPYLERLRDHVLRDAPAPEVRVRAEPEHVVHLGVGGVRLEDVVRPPQLDEQVHHAREVTGEVRLQIPQTVAGHRSVGSGVEIWPIAFNGLKSQVFCSRLVGAAISVARAQVRISSEIYFSGKRHRQKDRLDGVNTSTFGPAVGGCGTEGVPL